MHVVIFFLSSALAVADSPGVPKLEIVSYIPHSGYSEGLDFRDGYLWHALPKSIVKIDPKDGTVLGRYKPATEYSESVVWQGSSLWNLSFSDNGIYRGVLSKGVLTFEKKGITPEVHGWGLAFDGTHLVMTGNYSPKLYFFDPKKVKLVRTLTATISDLEDLAWDGTGFWSSSFTQHRGQIFRIHPQSGKVMGFFSLPDPDACPVIDGIAKDGDFLWVTGKECTRIYKVKIPTALEFQKAPKL